MDEIWQCRVCYGGGWPMEMKTPISFCHENSCAPQNCNVELKKLKKKKLWTKPSYMSRRSWYFHIWIIAAVCNYTHSQLVQLLGNYKEYKLFRNYRQTSRIRNFNPLNYACIRLNTTLNDSLHLWLCHYATELLLLSNFDFFYLIFLFHWKRINTVLF